MAKLCGLGSHCIDEFDLSTGFDEIIAKLEAKPHMLGHNDIKSVLADCKEYLIDNVSICTADTTSLSDCSSCYEDDLEGYLMDLEQIVLWVPVPKQQGKAPSEEWAPTSILVVSSYNTINKPSLLHMLFDSGGHKTMIHRRVLPEGCIERAIAFKQPITTLAGNFIPEGLVWLCGLCLPEFDKSCIIDEQKAIIFDAPCQYDIIVGGDFLKKAGINLMYETGMIEWMGISIPMRVPFETDEEYTSVIDDYLIQMEEDDWDFEDEYLESYLTTILDAKYEKANIDLIISAQRHLDDAQQNDLRTLLKRHEPLFNGTLGLYPHKKMHIELELGAQPKHYCAYPIPHVHLATFKRELEHLIAIGVLEHQGTSEWAMPSFIIPKKDGHICWISDLHALNKVIKRRQYPLPIITDILQKCLGYKFFTKLDISMQYYTFELDDESKDLCTIVTPFGKY